MWNGHSHEFINLTLQKNYKDSASNSHLQLIKIPQLFTFDSFALLFSLCDVLYIYMYTYMYTIYVYIMHINIYFLEKII